MAEGAGLRLTIDLAALAANWRTLAGLVAPAECAAVVKADAYGIGIEQAIPALWNAGCRTFFVALPEEGRRVRAAAPQGNVYVLSAYLPGAAHLCRQHGLRPVLNSLADVEFWAAQGGGAPSALHVDTGMNRLGLSLHDSIELARRPKLLAAAAPALLMSHLACTEESANPLNRAQLALLSEIAAELPKMTLSLANSAGIFLERAFACDLARPGIALYGGMRQGAASALQVAVTLHARVIQVRDAAAGETVGYGAAERLKQDSRLATLSAGYADGYLRQAGSSYKREGAKAWIRGHAVPVVGRVSMDLTVIDVTGIPGVVAGDWAELFGPNLSVEAVAAASGTISYELLAGLSRRAERIYVGAPRT